MKKPYQITEYESFVNKENSADGSKYHYLPTQDFEALLDFVRFNKNKKDNAEELFSISEKSNVTYIIAKNYVGLILLKNGKMIEILPKIGSTNFESDEVKALVTKMLSTLIRKETMLSTMSSTTIGVKTNSSSQHLFIFTEILLITKTKVT